jgi:serine/threonine protein kinase/Tol biopolymer transport system component
VSQSPGTRFGPYEVTAQIGAGGMGEVYRATDTNLGRDVALKVLPEAFAHDADRLARFEREARTLATLNHPNIAAVYGLEKTGDIHALVMELVEGPTLADRMTQGALPVEEALPIAKQITDALAAAHDHGIVHRDLKPGNIKVRHDGTVKVLDFGLAKTIEPTGAASNASLSPTITTPAMTQLGVILGTAGYMSPEQARGQAVDRASDIWAFGCVLYEMLAGKQAFTGDTITDILGGIVRVDPDWTALPDATPAAVRSLVRRCLHKDRKRRLKDIADASLEIEEALAEASKPAITTPTGPHAKVHKTRERIAWVLAGGLLLLAGVILPVAIVHLREPVRDDRPIQFEVLIPGQVGGAPPAISPDGRRLAFVASAGGRTQLWLRRLDSTSAQPLAGTEGADYPFWSPDSRLIAFFSSGKLRKIDASGGPPETICDAPIGRGGAWSRDGVIVFAQSATGPLYRVAASGGTSTLATMLDTSGGEIYHRSPSFLPDGRHFVFMVQGSENSSGIHIGSLEEGGHRLLVKTISSSGTYAVPGYLLFMRDRTLVAQRFDTERLTLTGEIVPIAQPVGVYNASAATFSVSDTGVLAYSAGLGGIGSDRQLAWFDRNGKLLERIGSPMPIQDVALSPDGKRAAVQWLANDIRVVDLARGGVPSRLTFNTSVEDFPVWSPDGKRILYNSTAGGGQNMYSKMSSGAGDETELLKSASVRRPTDWSRRFILYEEDNQATQADLWYWPLSGDAKPTLLLRTPFAEQQARLSSDERWVAYVSDDTGTSEVSVQSFPPSGGKWQVSTKGGVTPRWRRDGKELFYLSLDRKIMSVEVATSGDTFEYKTAKALFETTVDNANTTASNRYDVSADGQRFLINASIENTDLAPPITIVVNWLAGITTGQ